MKKLIIAFLLLIILSCNTVRDPQVELVAFVEACIDSSEIKENMIHVCENDYENYQLYYIYGNDVATISLLDTTLFPTNVIKYKDKQILLFEIGKKSIDNDAAQNLMRGFSDSLSTVNWFYLVDKKTKDGIFVRNEELGTAAFDVPIIRDRLNERSLRNAAPIDIGVSAIWFDASDLNDSLGGNTLLFPYKLNVNFTIYDRGGACNTFDTPLDSLGKFVLLYERDTLVINAKINFASRYTEYTETKKQKIKEIIPGRYFSHNKDWDICGFYSGKSANDEQFFKNIPLIDFYQNLYRILRDSLYYIPNETASEKYFKKECNYPKKRIRIFFPPNMWCVFYDSPKEQVYQQGKLIGESF